MSGLLSTIDPDGLLEYSVVYTDRALNHMSQSFQGVMKDISASLKQVYNAHSVAIIPGSGTFAMEAVARQFATDQTCLVIRNGWFSYRWTQIFEMGKIPASSTVLKARPIENGSQAAFAPVPIEDAIATIKAEKPAVVFAPHVETSAGMILPNDYLKAVADAVHSVGGLFVLDCIASGTIWVDMEACGIDVLISAPQKGWSSSPCSGLVMLSALGRERVEGTTSSSFSCDLLKWLQIMETYEQGGHAYHATMPTDALTVFRNVINETQAYGLERVCEQQQQLGDRIRTLLVNKGIKSVAAEGFQAPSVIVSYTDDPEIQSGKKFKELGMQIAAGVPLRCDELEGFQTFRIGLFGLDKLQNVDRTIAKFEAVLNQIV
ncbi:MAG: aminotransferase class V-fold PLP-dependent enzyme [Thermosynechococcaceae cyanobacterium]